MDKKHFFLCIWLWCVISIMGGSVQADGEVVTLFPTYAAKSADGGAWKLNVHAWVYELEGSSFSRKALLYLLAKKLGLSSEASESKLFHERARFFLVDNERGEKVALKIADQEFVIGPSAKNGHITDTLSIPISSLDSASKTIRIEAEVVGERDSKTAIDIPLIEPEGLSVVSDIDDTIKISEVSDKRALLMNTFCQEFRAVPEMAALYRTWSGKGAVFHYVSASPWQLHPALSAFLNANGFPSGSMSLKSFRWKDSSFFDLFAKSNLAKQPFIEELFKNFPQRKFILVGDTGELDAEMYGELARKFPAQIERILIRNSSGEDGAADRLKKAFAEVPEKQWQVFTAPSALN